MLVLLAGCDVVFRIDRLSATDAGPGSSDAIDAPPVEPCAAGMHDEDHDGHADKCDLCPGIADDQSDADGDGVGNACDPNDIAPHELALFLPMADDPQGWTPVEGGWTRDGESMVCATTGDPGYSVMVFQGTMPDPPFVLTYHYSVDAIDDIDSSLQVVLDSNPSGDGILCGHRRHDLPSIHDVVRSTYGAVPISEETDLAPVKVGGYRVTATYDRDSVRCAIASDDNTVAGTVQLGLTPQPTPGTLAFRLLRLGVHLHYVAIYKEL